MAQEISVDEVVHRAGVEERHKLVAMYGDWKEHNILGPDAGNGVEGHLGLGCRFLPRRWCRRKDSSLLRKSSHSGHLRWYVIVEEIRRFEVK